MRGGVEEKSKKKREREREGEGGGEGEEREEDANDIEVLLRSGGDVILLFELLNIHKFTKGLNATVERHGGNRHQSHLE